MELVAACQFLPVELAKRRGNLGNQVDLIPVQRHGFGSLALTGFGLNPFGEVSGEEPPFDIGGNRGNVPPLPCSNSQCRLASKRKMAKSAIGS
jgi:hypothetical protein